VEGAQPAALNHRGPAQPHAGVRRRDDHVAAAEDHRVAREAVAAGDAHQRHQPGQLRPLRECRAVQAGVVDAVGVAGAAAAALGVEEHGQPQPLGDVEEAVLLEMVPHPLRAREHCVIIRADGDVRAGRGAVAGGGEAVGVHGAEPREHPVGGRARHEVLQLDNKCTNKLKSE